MAKRKAGTKKTKQAGNGENGGIISLTKELFQAAITLRGSVEPADYKRYVLPIIFLRFLSLRYDRRRAELEALIADKKSDYFGDKKAIHDPDEYRRVGAFVIPGGRGSCLITTLRPLLASIDRFAPGQLQSNRPDLQPLAQLKTFDDTATPSHPGDMSESPMTLTS
jgi:type I restriction-modification system DNA methylase subunit